MRRNNSNLVDWVFWGALLACGVSLFEVRRNTIQGRLRGFIHNAWGLWYRFRDTLGEAIQIPRELECLKQVAGNMPFNVLQLLAAWVHNHVQYRTDLERWGQVEKWQSPSVTMLLGTGDCEDSSLLLYNLLHEFGYRSIDLVVGSHGEEGHAWVEAKIDGNLYTIETTTGTVRKGRPNVYHPAVWLNYLEGPRTATI